MFIRLFENESGWNDIYHIAVSHGSHQRSNKAWLFFRWCADKTSIRHGSSNKRTDAKIRKRRRKTSRSQTSYFHEVWDLFVDCMVIDMNVCKGTQTYRTLCVVADICMFTLWYTKQIKITVGKKLVSPADFRFDSVRGKAFTGGRNLFGCGVVSIIARFEVLCRVFSASGIVIRH